MVAIIEKETKTILLKRKFIDSWFWERYALNPYQGCQFGCFYCDTRSQKYYLHQDFSETVYVKTNATKLLDKRLSNARTLLPDVVALSGSSDPYPQIEQKYRTTRNCLRVLKKHNYPVHIITKSQNVLDDLALLEQIGCQSWSTVSITITTLNADKACFLEPNAPNPQERLDVLKTIKQSSQNIQCGILLMPVTPFLTDVESDLEVLIKTAKEAGSDYILFSGAMTMRDRQALYFLEKLKNKYPNLLPEYEDLYQFKYNQNFYDGKYGANYTYTRNISKLIYKLCKKHNIPIRIKRFIPNDYRKHNYIIAEMLLSMAYEKQTQGEYCQNLFWAGQNIQSLKESIEDVFNRKELYTIKNVYGKIRILIENYFS
ncbi:MAG: radical SAM protein [bacterium]|nr:radical SAM protein [bacterium]